MPIQPDRRREREGDNRDERLDANQQFAGVEDVGNRAGGNVSRNIGRVMAICTADTINGSGLRLVMSQLEAVSNIVSPMVDTALAMRMTVKAVFANRPQRDFLGGDASGWTMALLVKRV